MGLDHLGLPAVEAVAVKGVRVRVNLLVEVDRIAWETNADSLGQDGAVLEGEGLEEPTLGGDCSIRVLWVSFQWL